MGSIWQRERKGEPLGQLGTDHIGSCNGILIKWYSYGEEKEKKRASHGLELKSFGPDKPR
jgi:hypothetical protein